MKYKPITYESETKLNEGVVIARALHIPSKNVAMTQCFYR